LVGVVEFVILFFMSALFVKEIIRYAPKLGLVDIPNRRSQHTKVTPTGAGIAFIFAFFVGMLIFNFSIFIEYWYLFLSIILVFLVGIYDDLSEVSVKLKFFIIGVAVYILWKNGFCIKGLGNWFSHEVVFSSLVALLFTMFAVSGFTNALNLIDGIDGLSGSISVIILAFFVFLGYEYEDALVFSISLSTIAVIFGFLLFNRYPAKIFMGDSGSLTLGFIISIVAIKSLDYLHPVVILFLTAIPIMDTLIVMFRRILQKRSPFSPDKTHLHHIMVNFFDRDINKTVLFLSTLQLIFSLIGYMLSESIKHYPNGYLPIVIFCSFVLMVILFYMIFTGILRRQKTIDRMGARE